MFLELKQNIVINFTSLSILAYSVIIKLFFLFDTIIVVLMYESGEACAR